MGRVIAIGEGGKPQAPARDDRFRDLIDYVLAGQLLHRPILSPACNDWPHADEVRRALLRSARHFCSCGRATCARRHKNYPVGEKPAGCPYGGQRVGATAKVVRDDKGKLRVQVEFKPKAETMAHVVAKYGTDPNKWPYNPWAKRIRAET